MSVNRLPVNVGANVRTTARTGKPVEASHQRLNILSEKLARSQVFRNAHFIFVVSSCVDMLNDFHDSCIVVLFSLAVIRSRFQIAHSQITPLCLSSRESDEVHYGRCAGSRPSFPKGSKPITTRFHKSNFSYYIGSLCSNWGRIK